MRLVFRGRPGSWGGGSHGGRGVPQPFGPRGACGEGRRSCGWCFGGARDRGAEGRMVAGGCRSRSVREAREVKGGGHAVGVSGAPGILGRRDAWGVAGALRPSRRGRREALGRGCGSGGRPALWAPRIGRGTAGFRTTTPGPGARSAEGSRSPRLSAAAPRVMSAARHVPRRHDPMAPAKRPRLSPFRQGGDKAGGPARGRPVGAGAWVPRAPLPEGPLGFRRPEGPESGFRFGHMRGWARACQGWSVTGTPASCRLLTRSGD